MAGTNTYPLKVADRILPDSGHGNLHLGLLPELQLLFVISTDNRDRPILHFPLLTNARGKDSAIGL
eukprot:1344820-Prorocentrum_lima.AAC.1